MLKSYLSLLIVLSSSPDSPIANDEQALVDMIRDVNDTQVDVTDRLSYHLFAHSADGLRIVA